MKNRLDFNEYSRLLGGGLFADRVLLALLKFAQKKDLETEDREILGQARDFLDEVIAGSNFSTRVFLSYSDVLASQAFTQAIDATSIPLSSKEDFLYYIEKLRATVERILEQEAVGEHELNELIKFFTRYSRTQFRQSNNMLECV